MLTHLRIAASVGVLSTGLLIGSAGGAIATAEPESGSGGTTGQSQGGAAPAHGGATGPVGHLADSVRRTLQATVNGVTDTLNSLARGGQRSATGSPGTNPATTPPVMILGGTPTAFGSTSGATTPIDPGAVTPVTPSAPDTQSPATTGAAATTPAAPASDPLETASDPAVTAAGAAKSAADGAAGSPAVVATAHDPAATTSTWLGPVSKAFVEVANSVVAVPNVIASLPTSTTPVDDIVGSIQHMLSSVVDAGTSLTQLPRDLSGLLGATVGAEPTIGGAAGHGAGLFATSGGAIPESVAPSFSQLMLPTESGSVPASNAVAVPVLTATLATKGTSRGLSSSEVPLVSSAGPRNDTLSNVERVLGAVVASVSITALAAMALPGVGALLASCAAGIRIGYRQAKAGATLPSVVARFTGSGPLGVVRSGSRVELHPRSSRPSTSRQRSLRVVRTEPAADRLLEEAV